MLWKTFFEEQEQQVYYQTLMNHVMNAYEQEVVYPPKELLFEAFSATPFDQVKVVILGQDPYHDEGQANGLAFSIEGEKYPPSLKNIFKLVELDGYPVPLSGDLHVWAKQGVLLLNRVLSVRAHEAHSHQGMGWEQFSEAVIRSLSQHHAHLVFILWGKPAQQVIPYIAKRHTILTSVHPSPLSAYRGFFDSHCFKAANQALLQHGQGEIIW